MAISPAIAAAAPSPIVDDVSAGTTDANTWLVEPGELRLKPTTSSNFDGTVLSPEWPQEAWNPGGAATLAGAGSVSIDGARINTVPTIAAGQVLEFRATFGSSAFQSVGFGDDFNDGPWAMFSTGGGALPIGLHVRSLEVQGSVTDTKTTTLSPAIDPLVSHVYRIEWSASAVTYLVDGNVVATHDVALALPMRPIASDYNTVGSEPVNGGAVVKLDYLGVSPSAGTRTGAFESRVHAADDARAVWGTLTPAGSTGVSFATRTGNTATPDGTWSQYKEVAGATIQSSPGKYIQYRATLSTATNASPNLDGVSLSYAVDATAPTASIDGIDVSGTTAALRFSSTDADVARFECSLDGGGFAACASPKQFTGLSAGAHTASVKAIDRVGNEGQAVSQGFTITTASGGVLSANTPDTLAPKVKIAPRSVRASRRGIVRLGVTCPMGEVSCEVDLKLKRGGKTVARKVTMVDGGETMEFKLTLKQAARLRLAERGRLNVTAVAKTEDAAGNSKKVKRSITLRPHTS